MDKVNLQTHQYLSHFNTTILICSAISGITVVIIILIIGLFDSKLVDRVSLRLTLAISFVDFLRATIMLIYLQHKVGDPLCTLIASSVSILTLTYIFLTM